MDRRELAEAPREAHLLVLDQRLAAQQDHQVTVPRVENRRECALIERARCVHAADLRAERAREGNDF